jgi:hypothetical protein
MSGAETTRTGGRWRAAVLPLVAVLVVAGVVLGVRALVSLAPAAPSLAPPAALTVAPAEAEPLSCPRGATDHRAAVERLRSEHAPGTLVDAAAVIACPAGLDGLEVRLVGEVVGDVVRRRGGVWLTVNDDAHARAAGPLVGHGARAGANQGLAVWAPDGAHEALGPPGRAGRRGDLVAVTGIVHRADPADGGGLTVRASAIEVLAPGASAVETTHRTQAIAAAIALVLVAGAGLARVSAGRAGRRAGTTGRATRSGRRRSRAGGRRRPDARGG